MPRSNDIKARLMRCFAAVFPKLNPKSILEATPDSVADWDSAATITLLTVIEEEFGVLVEPETLSEPLSFQVIEGILSAPESAAQ